MSRWKQTSVGICLFAANIIIVLNTALLAQDSDTGRMEYLSKCAACHGIDGRGAGPLSAKLKTKPANLTILAERNSGTFSTNAIFEMIDGRKATRSHGSNEMPIWGCRHEAGPLLQKKPQLGSQRKLQFAFQGKVRTGSPKKARETTHFESLLDLSCDSEPVIQNRILSIVEYLKSIQEK